MAASQREPIISIDAYTIHCEEYGSELLVTKQVTCSPAPVFILSTVNCVKVSNIVIAAILILGENW